MELQAAISALKSLKEPCEVTLFTDSEYLRGEITEWLPRWKPTIGATQTASRTYGEARQNTSCASTSVQAAYRGTASSWGEHPSSGCLTAG